MLPASAIDAVHVITPSLAGYTMRCAIIFNEKLCMDKYAGPIAVFFRSSLKW